MTRKVLEAVNKAREFFEIENFPGDFFVRLEKVDYSNKYNLLLFKEDLDKLSGFIGYGNGDISVKQWGQTPLRNCNKNVKEI